MVKRVFAIILASALCMSAALIGTEDAAASGNAAEAGAFSTFSTVYSSYAVTSNGDLYSWGANSSGQLGHGDTVDRHLPTRVQGLSNVVSVSRLWNTSAAAITESGDLYTWGADWGGQLGHGDTLDRATPTRVQGLSDVVAVSFGEGSGAAITANGDLYTWGNYSFRLGHGDNNHRNTPTRVQGLENVVAVGFGGIGESGSGMYCAALTADGNLYTWGTHGEGAFGSALGHGDITTVTTPTRVQGLPKVVAFSTQNAQFDFCAAITENGDLYTWGVNSFGQLGHGDTIHRSTPTRVQSLSNVVAVNSTNGVNVTAMTANGDFYTWGGYTNYDIERGTPAPTRVQGLSNVVAGGSGFAITANGDFYSWGSNWAGQLGLGDDTGHHPPTRVQGLSNVVAGGFGWAITAGGDLYMWGSNYAGQLGLGDTLDRHVPTFVMSGLRLPNGAATPAPPLIARPTSSRVLVDGNAIEFDAYNIDDSNYFKLRDLAFILSGSGKQFEVIWDGAANAIILTSGQPYTAVGGEMQGQGAGDRTPTPTSSTVYLDGTEAFFTAYNINGNNYFRLRDIGEALDFGVEWDGASNTIVIDTTTGYTPG